jgi:hypothetical protein
MKPTIATPAAAATATRSNRILVFLAVIWMVASLAFGGIATADLRSDPVQGTSAGDTASRP